MRDMTVLELYLILFVECYRSLNIKLTSHQELHRSGGVNRTQASRCPISIDFVKESHNSLEGSKYS